MRKLIAALACRNKGTRLYGKPLQNLDITDELTILDNIVNCLNSVDAIAAIVLGIAQGSENNIFVELADKKGIEYIRGSEVDVLGRLIQCGEHVSATDIYRSTSESPFPFFEEIDQCWDKHVSHGNDATFIDHIIDGCGFEILTMEVLKRSHREGQDKHRSELCTLYLRENKDDFLIEHVLPPKELIRKDLRLTVDYPEDLIVCRAVYEKFKCFAPNIPLLKVVDYLDNNSDLVNLIAPFCEDGYSTMYL